MKKQSGSVLVLTAITVAVLMVAGVSFVSHTVVEHKANVNSTQTVQAFYLAEGGLAWGLEKLDAYIADQLAANSSDIRFPTSSELPSVFDLPSLTALDSDFQGLSLSFVVDPANGNKATLTATSIHNGAKNVVSQVIELFVQYGEEVPEMGIVMAGFPNAILSNGNIVVSSSNVNVSGTTLISNGTTVGTHADKVSYTVDTSGEFQKILDRIPTPDSLKRDLPAGAIPLPANGVLHTGTDPNAEVAYYANGINTDISLTGVGKARIHITGSVNVQNRSINWGGDSSRLTLYVEGASISLSNANAKVAAAIWTPNASISFSSNARYEGSIVSGGSNISIGSNNTSFGFILAPFANVAVTSNALVDGGIVCDTVSLQSGATIMHNPSEDAGYYVSTIIGSSSSGSDSAQIKRRSWANR